MVTKSEPTRWRRRAVFTPGKTRRQRKAQWQQQVTVMIVLLAVVVLAAAVVIVFNWRNAGSAREVSCAAYPQYCVPFVGGGSGAIARGESADVRELDNDSHGAAGVVRGYSAANMPFIGDPDAPVHFRLVFDFSCGHCSEYHDSDLYRLIENEILKGRASLEAVILAGVGGDLSLTAAQAALCAGEQGAFWEMSDELFRLSRSLGAANAYDLAEIRRSADAMGLDSNTLAQCVASDRYAPMLNQHQDFAYDIGATHTPTMVVSYGESGTWTAIAAEARDYDSLKTLIEAAQP